MVLVYSTAAHHLNSPQNYLRYLLVISTQLWIMPLNFSQLTRNFSQVGKCCRDDSKERRQ